LVSGRFHPRLGLCRERDLDVELAESFAGLAVKRGEHALPAWLDLLLAEQGLAVEVEVLLHERFAQVRRGAVDRMEAQVALPLGRGHVDQHLAHFGVEGRHREREHLRRGHALRLEELRPREVRCQLVGVGGGDRVVIQLDVAREFLVRLRHLRQARLERHHVLGLLGGIRGSHAGQFEHLGHMRDIRVALVLLVGVEVVVLVGQSKAALGRERNVEGGILEVRFGIEAEQDALALGGALAQVFGDAGAVGQRIDFGEMALQRFDALGIDLGLVHAGGVEVTDDLVDAGGIGLGSSLFGQLLLHGAGALGEHFERAPTGAIARDRVGRQPLAVDVAVEVAARGLRRVEVVLREAVDARQLGFVERIRRGCRIGRGIGGAGVGRSGFALARGEGKGDGEGQHKQLRFVAHVGSDHWGARLAMAGMAQDCADTRGSWQPRPGAHATVPAAPG
jgi:hypothetical protein